MEFQNIVKQFWKKESNSYSYWNISAYDSTTDLIVEDFMSEALMPIKFDFITKPANQVHLEKGKLNTRAIAESINFDDSESMQLFIENEIRTKISEGYTEINSETDTSVLFVQIQFTQNSNDEENLSEFFDLLDLRSEIQEEINNALKTKSLGSSFASDMGAGANILFRVFDFDKALSIVLKVLKKQKLDNRTLIAKRTESGYDVVHPKDFQGEFYSY
jgi:hypothetical protein